MAGAKDAYPKLWMAQIVKENVQEVSVFLHPSLYRALNLAFLTDIDGIVSDGQITSYIGTSSLGQSIGILTSADF